MEIHFLGAHNCESKDTRCTSLVIDDVLAFDAGGLTAALPFAAQRELKAVFLTHYHYDHVKDIPALGMNLMLNRAATDLYVTAEVRQALLTYLMNGDIYPRFHERPPENPTLKLNEVEPLRNVKIEGYSILPVRLNHAVPDVGYQVTSPDGKVLFYTGDTGRDLAGCWKVISPHLLIIEVTGPNRWEESMIKNGHLTPNLLKKELVSFRELKSYLPRVIAIHMNPYLETQIETELKEAAKGLNASIILAREGMRIKL